MAASIGAANGGDVPVWRRPVVLLALVAAAHAVLPLLLLGGHWPIGIDESVYLSQINAHVPPGGFSAPRARGATFLAAPVTAFTDAVVPMRVWTSLLSGAALFVAFRTWLRLRPGPAVPLAAALFASIWVASFYGFEVLPNEWVGFATVGACGGLLSYLLHGRRSALLGAALALGIAALLRPSDAVFALIAFVVICLLCRTTWRRRLVAGTGLATGALLGAADWVIEAHTTYHGLRHRLHVAEAEQGGSGLHWAGGAQLRVLAGPVLCRDDCHARVLPVYAAWWAVAVLFIGVALVGLRRMRRPILVVAPLVLGVVETAQYVFTIPYAAPRFLLPTYAAFALPCAAGVLAVLDRIRSRGRRSLAAAILAVGFLGHAAVQAHVVTARIAPPAERSQRRLVATASLLRRAGLTGPCVVLGLSGSNGPLAYRLRCTNVRPSAAGLTADLRRGVHVAWLRRTPPSDRWGYHWVRVHARYYRSIDVYLSTPRRLRS